MAMMQSHTIGQSAPCARRLQAPSIAVAPKLAHLHRSRPVPLCQASADTSTSGSASEVTVQDAFTEGKKGAARQVLFNNIAQNYNQVNTCSEPYGPQQGVGSCRRRQGSSRVKEPAFHAQQTPQGQTSIFEP